ncbi:ribosome maturation factor RimM [Allofranklinella schreckenbergeri]|nr:ribosome maturation factor RimM [Allofranklinella schreckenbergeri]
MSKAYKTFEPSLPEQPATEMPKGSLLGQEKEQTIRGLLASLAKPAPGEALIDLAYIAGAFGVKGWVRISPFSADADALHEVREWFIAPPQGAHARGVPWLTSHLHVRVQQLKSQSDGLVAKFEGVDDRDVAHALRGATIALPRSAFPALPEGEFYWVDLIGLEVRNRQGIRLGQVEKLFSNGPQSVLVVQGAVQGKPKEHLIPFVGVYVDTVDLSDRQITVDWQPDY